MSSATSTYTRSYTRTHTATHLSDVIMSSIWEILATLGIDTTRLGHEWEQDVNAIAAWIEEGSLRTVSLECHRPSGTVEPIFEFDVRYEAGGAADKTFTADNASLMRYTAKLGTVPAGTTYRLFCSYNGGYTPQPGWGPGTKSSTAGLRSRTIGTLAGAPHATASTRVYI